MTTPLAFTCDDFDALLPDLLEGTLDRTDAQRADAHKATCVRCTGLVAELDDIRTEAAALPTLSPSRDLWAGIQERIEAPVVDLAGRRPPAAGRRELRWAIAAALLIAAVSSGITYQVMRSGNAVATVASVAQVASNTPSLPGAIAASPVEEPTAAGGPRPAADEAAATTGARGPRPEARVSAVSRKKSLSPDAAYEKDVAALRRILNERRDVLDPHTVAILESSLTMIDSAIAQSRTALKQDPNSAFLREQLNNALDKKVELLRTVALLPRA